MTSTPKSPARRFTRLTTILVVTSLLAAAILIAVWFAAPGLLARKAARRATLASGALLVDGLPLSAPVDLFQTSTASHHITQRQLRMAFRGAAGTLQNQLGQPPLVLLATPATGQKYLTAIWQLPNAYIQLTTGSDPEADITTLRALPGIRPPLPAETPATLDQLSTLYTR